MPDINFKTLLIPVASSMVGLIPVLINLTVNWLDRKSHTARRDATLTYLNQRVAFLMNWFLLQKEVSGQDQLSKIKNLVGGELTDVYEEFAEALLEVEKASLERRELLVRVKSTGAFRRFFLLYTPYNMTGWLYHTFYYMAVLPLLFILGLEIYKYIQTGIWFTDVPLEYLYAGGVLIILALLSRLFGRRAAKVVEERMTTLDRKTSPLSRSMA